MDDDADARRERMWATYGQPEILDAAKALEVLGITEVTADQVGAFKYRDREALGAYAAANLEHHGLSLLGTYDLVPDGVVGVLDLRPELARLDAEREKN